MTGVTQTSNSRRPTHPLHRPVLTPISGRRFAINPDEVFYLSTDLKTKLDLSSLRATNNIDVPVYVQYCTLNMREGKNIRQAGLPVVRDPLSYLLLVERQVAIPHTTDTTGELAVK